MNVKKNIRLLHKRIHKASSRYSPILLVFLLITSSCLPSIAALNQGQWDKTAKKPVFTSTSQSLKGAILLTQSSDSLQPDSATEGESGSTSPSEPLVRVAEIVVEGATPDLEDLVYQTVSTSPGETTTRSQLQQDLNDIIATGFFSNVQAVPEDTPLGVRITFQVEPNPILERVVFENAIPNTIAVLKQKIVDRIFGGQYGQIVNLQQLQQGIQELNEWYKKNGYDLAETVGNPKVSPDGIVSFVVAEGVIEDIRVRYFDEVKDGEEIKDGKEVDGEVLDFAVLREVELKPGDVFNSNTARQDLQRVFDLGIFKDLEFSFSPGVDFFKVIVDINLHKGQKGSLGAGFGFSDSKGGFLTFNYEDSTFNARNQKVTIEGEFGEFLFSLNTSLTNPGALNRTLALEIDPLSIAGIDALDSVWQVKYNSVKIIFEALLDPDKLLELLVFFDGSNSVSLLDTFAPDEQSFVVAKFQEALKIAEQENRQAEAALTLNNLGNFYNQNKQYELAINTYQQALEKFQKLNSPALELLTWVRLANVNFLIGQPSQSLTSYYKALEILQQLRNENKLEFLLGSKILNALKTEWRIDNEDSVNEAPLLLSLIEKTIILDIATIYSALGDYQQSLYMVNSPQFIESTGKFISEDLKKTIANLTSTIESELSGNDFFDRETFTELLNQFNEKLEHLIETFPERTRLVALSFIYSDLNEDTLSKFSRSKVREEFGDLREFAVAAINGLRSAIVDNSGDLGIEDPELKKLIFSAADFVLIFFDNEANEFKNQAISNDYTQDVLTENWNEKLESLTDSITNYLLKSEYLADFEPFLKPIIYGTNQVIVNNFTNERFNDNTWSQTIVDIAELILAEWPSINKFPKTLQVIKGFVYLLQGSSYYELGEYSKAANAYEFYLQSLSNLEPDGLDTVLRELNLEPDGLDNGLRELNFEENLNSTLIEFEVPLIKLKSLLEQFVPEIEINAHLKLAENYFELEQPLKSKFHYQDVLSLNQKLFEERSTLVWKRAQIAEAYYGIAHADLLLQNFESAQKAVETAIKINDNFFPKESLSGGDKFTTLRLQYGYGKPNRGNLSLGLNISPNNPLTTLQDSENIQACTTPETYFACRQKYFDLYLNLLTQWHKKSPSEGFNILAFEQSERARVLSPQIFQDLSESTNPSPREQKLLQRRVLLNEPISLTRIEQLGLDENTVLLEYFLGENKSYLWLVSKGKPLQTFELPPREVIEAKAREFYTLLTEPSGRVRPRTTTDVGQQLSTMILGPIADQLDGQRLLVVGDGLLQYIPFGVLPNPTPYNLPLETDLEGEFTPYLKPLILEHEIVTLPSASSLVAIREDRQNHSKPTKELAIIADPVFNHEDDRVKEVAILNGATPFKRQELEKIDVLYGALPNTREELSSIEKLLEPSQRESFSGYDANLDTALSPELGQFRIVHFASHGIFNTKSPERSGIVLSGIDEQGLLQPGLLSPSNAFNRMDLAGTELVVLSGCRTGLSSSEVAREGLTGLTGGLLAAGTDRIVASLWSVQDQATRELMSRFYKGMLNQDNPMTPAQALRAAQISMWEEPRWQTPYYWGAFIIQGEWQ